MLLTYCYTKRKPLLALFFVENDKKKLDWKPAFEVFSRVTTWVVVPIVLALIFGKMLDGYYGTEPVIFLIFAGIGFMFTCIGIVRVVKNYIKKLQDIEKESREK